MRARTQRRRRAPHDAGRVTIRIHHTHYAPPNLPAQISRFFVVLLQTKFALLIAWVMFRTYDWDLADMVPWLATLEGFSWFIAAYFGIPREPRSASDGVDEVFE